MKKIILLLVIILAAHQAMAKSIRVPADSATIQAGINGAVDGDTVLIADGTYTGVGNRDIDFGGKRIVLKSENGPEVTVIDCEWSGRGLYFHNGEDSMAVVEGLTIYHGANDLAGCGIYCESSSPRVVTCILRENSGGGGGQFFGLGGAGMYCRNSSPIVIWCVFVGNETGTRGAGMCCDSGSFPQILHCTFRENYAWYIGWYESRGGAIHCENSSPTVSNCTFYANAAAYGAGMSCAGSSLPELRNCIIAFVHPGTVTSAQAVYCFDQASHPALKCCNLYGNAGGDWVGCIADQAGVEGNLSANPLFCDAASGDLTLADNSPCAPANNDCSQLIGAFELGCGPMFNRRWYVKTDGSGDAPTIQAAIDSCMHGDTVVLDEGTYVGDGNRNISFSSKRIIVCSENGPGLTSVNCQGVARGFYFGGFEDSTARLEGLTIEGGAAAVGGGVYCHRSSPMISGCVFKGNSATGAGGGST